MYCGSQSNEAKVQEASMLRMLQSEGYDLKKKIKHGIYETVRKLEIYK